MWTKIIFPFRFSWLQKGLRLEQNSKKRLFWRLYRILGWFSFAVLSMTFVDNAHCLAFYIYWKRLKSQHYNNRESGTCSASTNQTIEKLATCAFTSGACVRNEVCVKGRHSSMSKSQLPCEIDVTCSFGDLNLCSRGLLQLLSVLLVTCQGEKCETQKTLCQWLWFYAMLGCQRKR